MGIDKISIAYTECRQYRLETISSTHTHTAEQSRGSAQGTHHWLDCQARRIEEETVSEIPSKRSGVATQDQARPPTNERTKERTYVGSSHIPWLNQPHYWLLSRRSKYSLGERRAQPKSSAHSHRVSLQREHYTRVLSLNEFLRWKLLKLGRKHLTWLIVW